MFDSSLVSSLKFTQKAHYKVINSSKTNLSGLISASLQTQKNTRNCMVIPEMLIETLTRCHWVNFGFRAMMKMTELTSNISVCSSRLLIVSIVPKKKKMQIVLRTRTIDELKIWKSQKHVYISIIANCFKNTPLQSNIITGQDYLVLPLRGITLYAI